jgi:polyribonucleotide nucleotidyltransferase
VLVGTPKGKTEITIDPYIANNGESPYTLDFTLCGKDGKVIMIEAMAHEYKESVLDSVLDLGMKEIAVLEQWQKDIVKDLGKEKFVMPQPVTMDEVKSYFKETISTKIKENIFGAESKKYIYGLEDEWKNLVAEKWADDTDTQNIAKDYYHHVVDELVHEGALKENKRVDGRRMDEVRALYAGVAGVSSLLHGTGIFYRGETHVLSVLTLGGPESATAIEGMEIRGTKRFTHHYNFPPFSSGETGRVGGFNRREMGHGFLAEKALTPVMPDKLSFPYTIRLVSESLASNGSTSQASICASSLALMDGGVPITRPVAGIAMGLILDETNEKNYKILTDIQGPEDHHGDMDFKVGGTREGVTALQLDIKVGGIPVDILKESLRGAKVAREHILDTIEATIAKPRTDISPYAPKIVVMKIAVDQIGLVIGGGGKTIKDIREKTGAEITIEDDGTVYITGKDGAAEKAQVIIAAMTKEWKIGDMTTGEVVKIIDAGAIVKLSEYTDGFIHISEIAPFRVAQVRDLLKEGMHVPVKVVAIDKERDRISLSLKDADKDFFKPADAPKSHQ